MENGNPSVVIQRPRLEAGKAVKFFASGSGFRRGVGNLGKRNSVRHGLRRFHHPRHSRESGNDEDV
jgi:hypothetical protein